jgi:hypothetical protein
MPPAALIGRVAEAAARLLGQPFHWPAAAELRRAAAAAGLHVERQRMIFRLPGALLVPPVLTIARRMSG